MSIARMTELLENSKGNSVSVSFTRPDDTTAYGVGDVVGTSPATNLTFANISPAVRDITIMGVSLEVDVNAVPSGMGAFRLHLYSATPTAIADNSAFNLIAGDRSKYLGWVDITVPIDIGDTLWVEVNNINKQVALASTSIYGVLETRAAYTPTSQVVKKLTLHVK